MCKKIIVKLKNRIFKCYRREKIILFKLLHLVVVSLLAFTMQKIYNIHQTHELVFYNLCILNHN